MKPFYRVVFAATMILMPLSGQAKKIIKTKIKTTKAESRPAAETAPELAPESGPTAETKGAESAPAAATMPTEPEGTPMPMPEKFPPQSGSHKGIAYASGKGCTPEPEGTQAGYTLRLEFLSGEGSVCDVKLEVRNVKEKIVFSQRIQSPWVYLDLPAGGYTVKAKGPGGKERKYSTQTTMGKIQKGRLYFD